MAETASHPSVKSRPSDVRLYLLSLLLIVSVVYLPSLKNNFTNWDDKANLLDNLQVKSLSLSNIQWMFSSTVEETYVPLTILSFAAEYHFFKFNPFIYHLDNLLLHLIVTMIIFYLGRQMGLSGRASFFTALIFGVHPMHTETVAWVTERKGLLYSTFFLLAWYSYGRYFLENNKRCYGLSLFFGLLSILAKPMAMSLPLILFLYDWFKGRKFNVMLLIEKIPFFLYIIPLAWLTYRLHVRIPVHDFIGSGLTWLWTLTFYIFQFIFPWRLTLLYELPKPLSILNYPYWLSILMVIGLIICFKRFHKNRWVTFGFLYYFLSIFYLLRYDAYDHCIVADRYLYLPSLGFCILSGYLIDQGFDKFSLKILNRIYRGIIIGIILLLSFKSYNQSKIWNGGINLWLHDQKIYPMSFNAYYNLAQSYLEHGDVSRARQCYLKASSLNPSDEGPYVNLGLLENQQGHFQEALRYYKEALRVNPRSVEAYNNLGSLYLDQASLSLAEENFRLACRYNTAGYIEPQNNLAMTLQKLNRDNEAGLLFEEILKKRPQNNKDLASYKKAQIELIEIYLQTQQNKKAADLGMQIINTNDDPDVLVPLADIFAEKNDRDLAFRFFTKALVLHPGYKNVYLEFGKFLGNLNQCDKAEDLWREGLRKFKDEPEFEKLIHECQRLH